MLVKQIRTEAELLDERRKDADILTPEVPDGDDKKARYRALAFSGGGIRSATFSLGVLEAIAADKSTYTPDPKRSGPYLASRLSTFDYLSTVSGGGYLGGFLCSLFQPNRLRRPEANPKTATDQQVAEAADDAVRVLTSGPPGRIRSAGPFDGDHVLQAPMAWLRENGRYLMPTGVGDAFYAAALGIRNWLALHYVIGTVLIMLLALVGWLRASAARHIGWVHGWEEVALKAVIDADKVIDRIWWSALFPLALAPVVLIGIPLGIAFWLVHERRSGKSWPVNQAVLGCVIVAAGLIGVGLVSSDITALLAQVCEASSLQDQVHIVGSHLAQHPLLQQLKEAKDLTSRIGIAASYMVAHPTVAGGLEVVAAMLVYLLMALFIQSAAVQRVQLTRWLAWVLVVTAGIVGLAIVDTLGQTLYYLATHGKPSAAPALTPAGLVAALVWLSRHFAAKDASGGPPAWLKKLPTMTLAGLAGILIFTLVGALWSMFVHWLVWNGEVPNQLPGHFQSDAQMGTLFWIVVVGLLLSVVTGAFPGFINLSSLQAFYSSRITRAYLGASNGARFKVQGAALSAAEPLPNDNLDMDDYFGPPRGTAQAPAKNRGQPDRTWKLKTRAPLHIINITVNKTVDPAEQLVQRDRKGQPMAVLPQGFSIDRQWQDGFPSFRISTEVKKRLQVGQWIGTSGAAFSTGIGRETSLGMSLLMGAANVRLGTWWESGMAVVAPRGIADSVRRLVGAMFRTQSYISYELRARFFGTHRQWQYLSDGGHFENTAIYELLRKERRVYQVFACDNGADPKYRFDDLANLIRLARIDLNVEIKVQTKFTNGLEKVFAGPEAFKRTSPQPAAAAVDDTPTPCAMLLWARHLGDSRPSTQIILFKPNVAWDASADVRQYAVEHEAFPQEPTADQFFDEAQWESYRALGFHLGGKVFNPQVMHTLNALARERIDGIPAAP